MKTALARALIFALAFSLFAPSTLAAYPKEAAPVSAEEQALQDATVNLYCRFKVKGKTYSSTGSGVFVDSRGIILTNAHVGQYFLMTEGVDRVKGECSVRTGSPAKERYRASVLYISPVWAKENLDQLKKKRPKGTGEGDFALLYVTGAAKGELPLSFPALALGTQELVEDALGSATVAGYPAEGLSFSKTRNRLEQVTAATNVESVRSFAQSGSDLIQLAPSAAARSGVSGGPVVSGANTLIGIATSVGSAGESGDRTLRAITLAHVNRRLSSEIGQPLASILRSDLAARAQATKTALGAELITSLTKASFGLK